MLYWTRNELHEFFFQKMGWLLLAGVAIFSLRGSALWFGRGKDAAPSVDQILPVAGYLLALPFGILILAVLVGYAYLCIKNYRLNRWSKLRGSYGSGGVAIFRESEFASVLGASLLYVFSVYLLVGLAVAWALNLPIFGGALGSVLTVVQIVAAAVPLAAKLMD